MDFIITNLNFSMRRDPFHLVDFSTWPLTGSIGALFLTSGLVGRFHGYSPLGAIRDTLHCSISCSVDELVIIPNRHVN